MVYELRIIFKRTRSSREVEIFLAFSGVSLDTPIRDKVLEYELS